MNQSAAAVGAGQPYRVVNVVVCSEDREVAAHPRPDKFSIRLDEPVRHVVGARLLLADVTGPARCLIRVNDWGHVVRPRQHDTVLQLAPGGLTHYPDPDTHWLGASQMVSKFDVDVVEAYPSGAPADVQRVCLLLQLVVDGALARA